MVSFACFNEVMQFKREGNFYMSCWFTTRSIIRNIIRIRFILLLYKINLIYFDLIKIITGDVFDVYLFMDGSELCHKNIFRIEWKLVVLKYLNMSLCLHINRPGRFPVKWSVLMYLTESFEYPVWSIIYWIVILMLICIFSLGNF